MKIRKFESKILGMNLYELSASYQEPAEKKGACLKQRLWDLRQWMIYMANQRLEEDGSNYRLNPINSDMLWLPVKVTNASLGVERNFQLPAVAYGDTNGGKLGRMVVMPDGTVVKCNAFGVDLNTEVGKGVTYHLFDDLETNPGERMRYFGCKKRGDAVFEIGKLENLNGKGFTHLDLKKMVGTIEQQLCR